MRPFFGPENHTFATNYNRTFGTMQENIFSIINASYSTEQCPPENTSGCQGCTPPAWQQAAVYDGCLCWDYPELQGQGKAAAVACAERYVQDLYQPGMYFPPSDCIIGGAQAGMVTNTWANPGETPDEAVGCWMASVDIYCDPNPNPNPLP